jgi:sugar phosphate permease
MGLTYGTYSLMYCTRKPLSVVKSTMRADGNLTAAIAAGGGGTGEVAFSLIDTAFFLMYMAGQFSMGILSPVLSTRAYLLLCVFGSASACFLFGLASSNVAMVALWGANGFAQSATNTLLINYLADIVPLHLRGSIL